MRPPPLIIGSSVCVRKYGLLTWILKRVSNCSWVVSANGTFTPMPALLTRSSKSPRPKVPARAVLRESAKAPKVEASPASSWSIAALPPPPAIWPTTASASSCLLW